MQDSNVAQKSICIYPHHPVTITISIPITTTASIDIFYVINIILLLIRNQDKEGCLTLMSGFVFLAKLSYKRMNTLIYCFLFNRQSNSIEFRWDLYMKAKRISRDLPVKTRSDSNKTAAGSNIIR